MNFFKKIVIPKMQQFFFGGDVNPRPGKHTIL